MPRDAFKPHYAFPIQEKLGEMIGVNKSQISKLENNANSARIETIIRVFSALKAEINFNVTIENNRLKIA